jgi:hypothetical protein
MASQALVGLAELVANVSYGMYVCSRIQSDC